MIDTVPKLNKNPLNYVFEDLKIKKEPNELWLEFGTFQGRTINYISKFTKDTVYTFDCLTGLPEKWRDGFEKGCFNLHGRLPKLNSNVELVEGLFQDTLNGFLAVHKDKKVSFIHMDADLYSSTNFVLETLKDHLTDGCIIVFDEFFNYNGWEEGEYLAFNEFVKKNRKKNIKYEVIGMENETSEPCAFTVFTGGATL